MTWKLSRRQKKSKRARRLGPANRRQRFRQLLVEQLGRRVLLAGEYGFALQQGGTQDDVGQAIAVDDVGNIYTAGYYRDTADFDPGPGTANLTSAGLSDLFVTKLDSTGNLVWAKSMGGVGVEVASDIGLDSSGNVYVTGYFGDTADFDPGPGTAILNKVGGTYDVFVLKLDNAGDFVWVKGMGGAGSGSFGYDQSNGLAVDGSANVYITGYFNGTADFDPGPGTANLTSSNTDAFIAKLDSSGDYVWAKNIGGSGSDTGAGIAVDAAGDVYTVGNFNGTADFDPGTGTANLTSAGDQDVFILKLDAAGNFIWSKGIGGTLSDEGEGIAVDSVGNVFITGGFRDTADFDPGIGVVNLTSAGDRDVFVSKLDSGGDYLWAKQMGGSGFDHGRGIVVDSMGNVTSTGYFIGPADFDPGSGTTILTGAGLPNMFVSQLDANGDHVFAREMGTRFVIPNGIALDTRAGVYTTGYFRDTIDFDPGPGTANLTSAGGYDVFVSKLKPPTLPTDDVVDENDGVVTLREAVLAANNAAGDDTITLGEGTYTLSILGASEDAAATGDLDVTDTTGALTIVGAGAGVTIIDAAGIDRALHVLGGAELNLVGVTITGGDTPALENGGAIYNQGTLTVTESVLTGNDAFEGGAIKNVGTATLSETSVTGNSAADGGGIHNASILTINNSTIADNVASQQGGGINSLGTLTLTSSTISGNTATGDGGGIRFSVGSLDISGSTLYENVAARGAGIFSSSGTVSVGHTIIAGNSATSTDPDVSGSFTTDGYNLIGDAGTATGWVDGVNGDQVGSAASPIDPLLGPLQDNGGATLTHVPLAGSPAIDAGNDDVVLSIDQRGAPRIVDGPDADTVAAADIGAVESGVLFIATKNAGGASQFTLSRNGAALEATAVDFNASVNLDDITVVVLQGADDVGETFTVDFNSGGAFSIQDGITIDGGNGAGIDSAVIVGDGVSSVGYKPDRNIYGNGVLSVGNNTIQFSGLEPVTVSNLHSVEFTVPADQVLSDGTVDRSRKIASGKNGAPVLAEDYFGYDVTSIGDLDGDGVTDVAVGAPGDNTGAIAAGAVHMLFMNADGTVKSSTKIASSLNGGPSLLQNAAFGSSVENIGDLDGDGVADLAVGAVGGSYGDVYIVFLNSDGTAKGTSRIGNNFGGGPSVTISGLFGTSVATVGDLNGDGVVDLAVGEPSDNTGGTGRGAVHVLFMNTDGTAQSTTKIASGFNGAPLLADGDSFGESVAAIGDLDEDGVDDLAVGAFQDDTGGTDRGAVHLLYLNSDGSVKNTGKLASGVGGVPALNDGDFFGAAVTSLGDIDGDNIVDLAVGAIGDDTGGNDRGAVHVLFLNAAGTANSATKIASTLNGGPGLSNDDNFGWSVGAIEDLNGDGLVDLAVGAPGEDHPTGSWGGAVHLLFLDPLPLTGGQDVISIDSPAAGQNRISGTSNGVPFESLTFFDVDNVTIDTGANDGTGPEDVVTVDASGLAASNLQSFTISTGDGDDSFAIDSSDLSLPSGGVFTYDGGAGHDSIAASGDVDYQLASQTVTQSELSSSAGGQIAMFNVEAASLTGGPSSNQIDASSFNGSVTINGADGNDTLRGGSGNDTLFGGLGKDEMVAGGGQDSIQELTGVDATIADADVVHTYTVTNTADAGAGSLRQAMLDANADTGADVVVIDFQIGSGDVGFVDVDAALPGGDVDADTFVITPATALPTINNTSAPIIINGQSQSEFLGDTNPFGPEIALDGNQSGVFSGLTINSSHNVLHGLNIQDFGEHGVSIGGAFNLVSGSYLGTDATGTLARGNARDGIFVSNAADNTIGSATASMGNLISGNLRHGVRISGGGSDRNQVFGNQIGLNAAGDADLGNALTGVRIDGGVDNTIGGVLGSGGNVISGNDRWGIELTSGAINNVVLGNLVGTDAAGVGGIANGFDGIVATVGPNQIGGTAHGAGNVISGNADHGISLIGAAASGIVIQGNLIGTDITGLSPLGNGVSSPGARGGIYINEASNNIIGGTAVGAGNVISANLGQGIRIGRGFAAGIDATGNVVQGNLIGTDATGMAELGNTRNGVTLTTGAYNNTVGGAETGARNIISGNDDYGVSITPFNDLAAGNRVQGNYIGLDISGEGALGNDNSGVRVDGVDNMIGGTVAGAGNTISANRTGISIPFGSDTIVQGNFIGTNASGTSVMGTSSESLGNVFEGIIVSSPGSGNLIGGAEPGARNIISGNRNGILIRGTDNSVYGNYIGTDVTGTIDLGNRENGVSLEDGNNNFVGGGAAGQGNLISGNDDSGVVISGDGNQIAGNYIGVDETGDVALRNFFAGIAVNGGAANVIGTDGDGINDAGEVNVISGNIRGISIFGLGSNDNVVAGNIIGLNADGTDPIPLSIQREGIVVGVRTRIGSDENGVSDDLERNIISGNSSHGIQVYAQETVISGNYIGTDITGHHAIGNDRGVELRPGSSGILVQNNVISGNEWGVDIHQSSNNEIYDNLLGTTEDGRSALANERSGVTVRLNSDGNVIGGPGRGNLISGNGRGIEVLDATTEGTVIQGNFVGLNMDGDEALPNTREGIVVSRATSVLIGTDGDGQDDSEERNVVSGNAFEGIFVIHGDTVKISGNYVGTSADGLSAIGNLRGVWVTGSNITVGTDGSPDPFNASERNVIAGHNNADQINGHGRELLVSEASSVKVAGNYIGTDYTGLVALGDTTLANLPDFAVVVSASGEVGSELVIGTDGDGIADHLEGNVISAPAVNRLNVSYGSQNVTIAGNIVGLDANGSDPIGVASEAGIDLERLDSSIRVGTNSDGISDGFEANVIAGNEGPGIRVEIVSDFTIAGNRIGTDKTGTKAIGNDSAGIELDAASSGLVGGSQPGAGNVIGGNGADAPVFSDAGILVTGQSETADIAIQGNFVGLDRTGAIPLGNVGAGILLDAVRGVIVGTDADGVDDDEEGNVIANNDYGVVIKNTSSFSAINNSVRGNSIFDNVNLGIDLGPQDGTTPNDAGDGDSGPNFLQNFPVLTAALAGAQTLVTGELDSTPHTTFDIDFYASPPGTVSPVGAKTYLGSTTATTNGDGIGRFRGSLPVPTFAGDFITATATDPSGNTSEISAAVAARLNVPPTIDRSQIVKTIIPPEESGFASYGLPTDTISENDVLNLTGLFDNLEPDDVHTVEIDWGDGTVDVLPNIPAGERGFAAQHQYLDDNPTSTASDTYSIKVTVTDDDGGSGQASSLVTVNNVVPEIPDGLSLSTATSEEGDAVTLTAEIVDPGTQDSHRVSVDWGDGTPTQILALPVGERIFSVTHTYVEDSGVGTYPINVSTTDDDGGQVVQTTEVTVANVAPSVTIVQNTASMIEGSTLVFDADVVDPGAEDTFTYNWIVYQDGVAVATGNAPQFSLTVPDQSDLTIGLTVTDDEGAVGSDTLPVTIVNAAPTFAGPLQLRDRDGMPVSGVAEGDTLSVGGVFADPGVLDAHVLTVDWGDGSPADVFDFQAGVSVFENFEHVYIDDNPSGTAADSYLITATISDFDGGASSATTTVEVSNVDPVLRIVDAGSDDTTIRLGNAITDPGADTYTYSWSAEPASLLPVGTPTDQPTISFPKPDDGTASIALTVTDDDGGTDTIQTLFIGGTSDDDEIVIEPSLAGEITVTITSDGVTTSDSYSVTDQLIGVLGDGADTWVLKVPINAEVNGGGGADKITTSSGHDLISGGAGPDTLVSAEGDDTLVGAEGDDQLSGGVGNDSYVLVPGSDKTVIEPTDGGTDTIDYSKVTTSTDGGDGITHDLSVSGTQTVDGNGNTVTVIGEFENLIGTQFNDALTGDEKDNQLDGGDGSDTLLSGAGNDNVFGGAGSDSIMATGGEIDTTTISGGEGNDSIFGGAGSDSIDGGLDDDTITGGGGEDSIFGGAGSDSITGGIDDSTISGGDGNDSIFGGAGADAIEGGTGDDSITSGGGNDSIFGGGGADSIISSGGSLDSTNVDGGQGNDSIFGGAGSDSLLGGDGNDTISGLSGEDSIFGGAGSDSIQGGIDSSTISGGDGDDSIFGGAGSDSIDGGLDNDTITTGGGSDSIQGGSDQATLIGGDGNDSIFGGAGSDSIDGGQGNDTISSPSGNDSIFGGAGSDSIVGGSDQATLIGGDGNDSIFGGAGSDSIDGGLGDDSISSPSGNDSIFGGAGSDSIVGGSDQATLIGGDGNDSIFGGAGSDSIDGGLGDDSISSPSGNDSIFGGAGSDSIQGGSDQATLSGGAGNDSIFGGAGSDSIVGGSDDDLISSSGGTDSIFGGDGNDTITGAVIGAEIFGNGPGEVGEDWVVYRAQNDVTVTGTPASATLSAGTLGSASVIAIEKFKIIGGPEDNHFDTSGFNGDVVLMGGAGNDTLFAGPGNDTLSGGAGDDSMVGGAGDDTYVMDGDADGNDVIVENEGDAGDTLDFSAFDNALNLDLESTIQQYITDTFRITLSSDIGIDNVLGTQFSDSVSGNSLNNKLVGFGGNDSLSGAAGDDLVIAGASANVFLDFDSATEGEDHSYSAEERDAIQARIRQDFAPFDVNILQLPPAEGDFITVLFNEPPIIRGVPQPGGASSRIGWRRLESGGTVIVDVNDFFGDRPNTLSGTVENYVALSSTIASHELAHIYGVRHQDAFGTPGTGIFNGVNVDQFLPQYAGPVAADETPRHLSASPASVGTTLVDALQNPFFGEREALKLAFGETGRSVPEQSVKSQTLTLDGALVPIQPLGILPVLAVPNTVERGVNADAGATLPARAINVVGSIELSDVGTSENDYYSFEADPGAVVTIEVMSFTLRHRIANPIDSVVRIYDRATGEKLPYYESTIGAINDDTLEPTDSLLLDLILPTTSSGSYVVEVDTFDFAAAEVAEYLPGFDVQGFCSDNPNFVGCADTDTGDYELLIYGFENTAVSPPEGDTVVGGDGIDTLIGTSGNDTFFVDQQDVISDPAGRQEISGNSPPVLTPVASPISGLEGRTGLSDGNGAAFTRLTATDGDADAILSYRLGPVPGSRFPAGATLDPATAAFNWTPADDGLYRARLVVSDELGTTDSQIIEFQIGNVDPTVTIHSDPAVVTAGETLVRAGAFSDVDADVVTATVDYGDGVGPELIELDRINRTFELSHRYLQGGTFTVTTWFKDEDGGESSASFDVWVNTAPAISVTNLAVSQYEGLTVTNTGYFSDADGDSVEIEASVGDVTKNSNGTWTWTYVGADGPAFLDDVSVTVTDPYNASSTATFDVTILNASPRDVMISDSISDAVFAVGEARTFSGSFIDWGVNDTHAADWRFTYTDVSGQVLEWRTGTVTQDAGGGTVSDSFVFDKAGVYDVYLRVTDDDGASTYSGRKTFVVYSPSEGFVTGAGWFESQYGYYLPNPSLTGRASFAFLSKYQNGKSTPSGRTEFIFRTADLHFSSSNYDWLVISGSRAQFRGVGTINGGGNYGFMITVIDGGGGGPDAVDRIRIKIWDIDNRDRLVYDTLPRARDDDASPNQELGAGTIIIHKKGDALRAATVGDNVDGSDLGQEQLTRATGEALAFWANLGVDASQLRALSRIDVRPADLRGNYLGLASESSRMIWIDTDAAGWGWGANGMNLVAALTHEYGHHLGLDHDVLESVLLPTRERRLLKANPVAPPAIDEVFSLLDPLVRQPSFADRMDFSEPVMNDGWAALLPPEDDEKPSDPYSRSLGFRRAADLDDDFWEQLLDDLLEDVSSEIGDQPMDPKDES